MQPQAPACYNISATLKLQYVPARLPITPRCCALPQVEFANLLVLNKVDLVTPEQADQLEALLHRLNVTAKVRGG